MCQRPPNTQLQPKGYGLAVEPTVSAWPKELHAYYESLSAELAWHWRADVAPQDPHHSASWREIGLTALYASQHSQEGEAEALVVGPGACHDVPLPVIVGRFAHTTLVDVDTAPVERAVMELQPKLRAKTTIYRADATGSAQHISQAVLKAGKQARNKHAFFAMLADTYEAMEVQQPLPALPGTYAFVASHLVLSQLANPHWRFIADVAQHRFSHHVTSTLGTVPPKLRESVFGFTDATQRQHIKWLASVTSPQGAVHFADTVNQLDHQADNTFQPLPLIADEVLYGLNDHFRLLRPEQHWYWQPHPKMIYDIMSFAMQPRAQ